ncbi:hypothetical protein KSS87_020753 [Heliosperma pusillum]|nr:hypothetical protein KSS87_020753 [Heliosperma pusillum]
MVLGVFIWENQRKNIKQLQEKQQEEEEEEDYQCQCRRRFRRKRRRQDQCRQEMKGRIQRSTNNKYCIYYYNKMEFLGCLLKIFSSSTSIHIVALFLLVTSSLVFQVHSSLESNFEDKANNDSQSFRPSDEVYKLRRIREHLNKINRTPIKTIQSLDGDLIDCIPSHEQLAFEHPMLRGQKPLDPPERPHGHERVGSSNMFEETFQLWHLTGETCSPGTIPIRRTSEDDMMRVSSISRFGRKPRKIVRRDSSGTDHEVSPELYGDNYPRFFTYWTSDAYQATGCYNLLCSGFVQTNSRIAIGAAISPTSSYSGGQFDISLLIWKDPKHGNWWLEFGSGILVGYWPSYLFTHLRDHATCYGSDFGKGSARFGHRYA